jgi:hypothetical protein
MTTQEPQDVAATIDHLLAVAGLTVTDAEREYFIRAYPILRETLRHLRIPQARNAEPAPIYLADNRREL